MAESLRLLDQALELGQEELRSLHAGEVEQAENLSHERKGLIDEAVARQHGSPLEEFRYKLLKLQSLQGQLTAEAEQLRDTIKQQLLGTRKHTNRMRGYGKATKVTPLYNRFLNKQG